MCEKKGQSYSNDWNVLRHLFWDGKDSFGNILKLDEAGIECSLKRALKDFTARTDKKQEDEQSASVNNMADALKEYQEELFAYFSDDAKGQQEFDQWHHTMCMRFVKAIKEKGIRQNISYGKAQKILNMTFKNLYCLEDAKEKQTHFAFCHLALDSFILKWFRETVATEWFNYGKTRSEKIKISENGPIPNWSNLQFKDGSLSLLFDDYNTQTESRECDGKYHYMFFVTMIRAYIEKTDRYKGLTPFQAEFYVWMETQYEVAAGGLLKQGLCAALEGNAGVITNNPTIKKQNEEIKAMLDKLSKFYC